MRSALAVAPVVAVDNNKDRDSSCSTPTITRRSLSYFSFPLFEVLRLQCAVLFFYQVYVGAPNIQDYAPGPHSYIDMRDFKTPSDLVAKLRELDSDDAQYQVRSFEVFRIIIPCKLLLACSEYSMQRIHAHILSNQFSLMCALTLAIAVYCLRKREVRDHDVHCGTACIDV